MKNENLIRNSLDSIYHRSEQKIFYLGLFADAIEEANSWENEKRKGLSNWSVVFPKKDKVRLIAGHHIVTTLNPSSIWMAFDEIHFSENPTLDNRLRRKIEWGKQNTQDGNYKLIGSINGYLKFDQFDRNETKLLMEAHRVSIEKAIKKDVLRNGSIRSHEPAFIDFLERIIGRDSIPRPIFE